MTAGWLRSPAFDLLAIANLWWPVALIPMLTAGPGQPLTFVQLYFLSAPHRWLTLLLVVADPDRRAGRAGLLLGLAIVAVAAVGIAWSVFDALACLILIDTLWNAWHFGGQHAGVLRMYARKAGGGDRFAAFEKQAIRLLVAFVGCRLATETLGLPEAWRSAFESADVTAVAAIALLFAAEFCQRGGRRGPKRIYLVNVLVLYGSLLAAMRFAPSRLPALAIASAIVHAVEYFAIVTIYAERRPPRPGAMANLVRNWFSVVALLAVTIGIAGMLAETGGALATVWAGLNLVASFLHYAYDGLIWKLRQPATARALGVA